jgi:hypothetical protein
MDKGTNYHTVAVIGCQSSGKSNWLLNAGTLLNLLFGTNFDEMNQDLGRSQTTQGIWLGKSDDGNILIFDIEGTDSKERGDQKIVIKLS